MSSRRATAIACLAVVAVWALAAAFGWAEETALDWIPAAGVGAAAMIIALLAADVVLPIPATLVMAASGALLGPVLGSVVNACGLLLGTEVGRLIGRQVGGDQHDVTSPQASPMRIAMTRGVPILGEAVALAAGAGRASRSDVLGPAALGSVAVGSVYAVSGSLVGHDIRFIVVGTVLAGLASVIVHRWAGWQPWLLSRPPTTPGRAQLPGRG